MERPLDARPVVVAEAPDVLDHVGDVGLGDLPVEERLLGVREARLRPTAEIHHDLDERASVLEGVDGRDDVLRQGREEQIEVVHLLEITFGWCHVASLMNGVLEGWIAGASRASRACQRTAGTSAGSATRMSVSFMSSVTVEMAVKP